MKELEFPTLRDRALVVLCLGAHSDDIEIGCGGTIMKLQENYRNARFLWVVFSSDATRRREAERSAKEFFKRGNAGEIEVNAFRDGFFPYSEGKGLKEYFEGLKSRIQPDLILTHYRQDLHQDHRLISDLTWNTFRDHLILEYEIPKYDGDLGAPNTYIFLSKTIGQKKVRHLMRAFRSQRENLWFKRATFESLLCLRGIESNAPEGFAEAFYCRKLVF